MAFDSPRDYDKVFWRRKGLWTVYPEDHIGRPAGEAPLFYEGLPEKEDPRVRPCNSWNKDYNQLGSNDFRSTRRNIWYAGLTNHLGHKITVKSNGEQHWRSWLEGDKIRFLIADFVSPGNEMFLESHMHRFRQPIKKGQTIEGTAHLIVSSDQR